MEWLNWLQYLEWFIFMVGYPLVRFSLILNSRTSYRIPLPNKYKNSKFLKVIAEPSNQIFFDFCCIILWAIVVFALQQHLVAVRYIAFIIILGGWSIIFASFVEPKDKSINAGNLAKLALFLILLGLAGFVFLWSCFALLQHEKEHVWWLEFIIVILMIIPSIVIFWRLIHICNSLASTFLVCFVNLLIIQGLLYFGIGLAIFPEKIISAEFNGNLIDWFWLVLNVGAGGVTQLPSVDGKMFPSTQMTIAYFLGAIVNIISTGFAISYIASWAFKISEPKK